MAENPTKIVVYHCRNLLLFKNGGHKILARSQPGLKLVAVPCSGKVEAHHLLNTLAAGIQGVLVLACQEKACQFLEGSMRSNKRVQYARTWLQELGIEPERLEYTHVPPADLEALESVLQKFRQRLKSFGEINATPTP